LESLHDKILGKKYHVKNRIIRIMQYQKIDCGVNLNAKNIAHKYNIFSPVYFIYYDTLGFRMQLLKNISEY